MTKQEIIDFFGTQAKTARYFKIGDSAVSQWPEENPPLKRQLVVQIESKGKLKANNSIQG